MNGHINNVTYLGWALETVPLDTFLTCKLHQVRFDDPDLNPNPDASPCPYPLPMLVSGQTHPQPPATLAVAGLLQARLCLESARQAVLTRAFCSRLQYRLVTGSGDDLQPEMSMASIAVSNRMQRQEPPQTAAQHAFSQLHRWRLTSRRSATPGTRSSRWGRARRRRRAATARRRGGSTCTRSSAATTMASAGSSSAAAPSGRPATSEPCTLLLRTLLTGTSWHSQSHSAGARSDNSA